MRFKVNFRWIIFSLLVAIVLWVEFSRWFFLDPNSEDVAGYVLPGVLFRDMGPLDSFQYLYNVASAHFGAFPLVVRFSFYVLFFCMVIGFFIMLVAIFLMVRRHRDQRLYHKMQRRYLPALREIILSQEPVSPEYISQRLELDGKSLGNRESNLWLRLLVHVYTEQNLNYKMHGPIANINKIAHELRLIEFIVKVFNNGTLSMKLITLDSVSFIHLDVPMSMMVRLVNSGETRMRKRARVYYAKVASFDPYVMLGKEYLNDHFTTKDAIEMYEIFRRARESNLQMPPFIQLLEEVHLPETRASLIYMFGTWCEYEDLAILKKSFHSSEIVERAAAYRVVALRRYYAGEPDLIQQYKDEMEELRREILWVVKKLKSGKAGDFLMEAFKTANSILTQLRALQVLYDYDEQSRSNYYLLREQSSPEDLRLFYHVEGSYEWRKLKKADPDMTEEEHKQLEMIFISRLNEIKKEKEISDKKAMESRQGKLQVQGW